MEQFWNLRWRDHVHRSAFKARVEGPLSVVRQPKMAFRQRSFSYGTWDFEFRQPKKCVPPQRGEVLLHVNSSPTGGSEKVINCSGNCFYSGLHSLSAKGSELKTFRNPVAVI